MRLAQSIAVGLLAASSLIAGVAVAPSTLAQEAPADDDDDDGAVDDDDADVPDPDDTANDVPDAGDPGDNDPVDNDTSGGGSDTGGSDGGSDSDTPDSGGDDTSGGDSGAPGGDDGDDDNGSGGQGSDDGPGDDNGSGGHGSDDGPGDDKGNSGSGGPGSDDGDSDDGPDETETDIEIDESSPVQIIGGGEESETARIELDEKDGIETDREGFRYRRNEFVAIDLDAKDIATLRDGGFVIVQSEQLENAGGTVHLVKGPERLSDRDALALLDDVADPGSLSFNHLFDSSSGEVRKVRARSGAVQTAPARTACGCQIGMIDTGVAARLPQFRHVAMEQRAFNAKLPVGRLHGTAVAYQFAGTTARSGRPTRIIVADIFSGDRASAGSTFSLVRALDWLAGKGVPVINVSLAGPRNAVVATTVERLNRRGHVIVAAAGNDGPAAPPVFPGAYSGVVAVTAVDDRQQVYRYANRGNYVSFSAYGVSVPTINSRGELTVATGTSFAAPTVAARLARDLVRPDPAANARLITQLEREARDLGAPGRDAVFGYGLLEAAR